MEVKGVMLLMVSESGHKFFWGCLNSVSDMFSMHKLEDFLSFTF